MPSTHTTQNTFVSKNKRRQWLVLAIIITAVIAPIDFFYTGYAHFVYSYIKCGKAPVALSSSNVASGYFTYNLPGTYTIGKQHAEYVCSADEAIKKGALRSVLD